MIETNFFFFELFKNGVDALNRSMEKPRTVDDVIDKTKPWQLAEIVDPGECRLVTLPESADTSSKVLQVSSNVYVVLHDFLV